MKSKSKQLGQYLFENHDYDGSIDDFLEKTAPLIGFIVHSFNSLDELLNSCICELINDRTDEPGAVVIYKMNFAAKVDLFYRLGRLMEIGCEGNMPSFKLLVVDLKECGRLRNAVVHAEWENMTEDGYTFVKIKFNKNGMQQQYIQFTPEALESIDELIHSTYMKFDKYEEEKNQLLST